MSRPWTIVRFIACVTFAATVGVTPAAATTAAPTPCTGALALYTRIGTLRNVNGSNPRPADVEARLAILRQTPSQSNAARVGWAYVDAEGDLWIAIDAAESRALADWRHVSPGLAAHAPAYALIERVGIPKTYYLAACAS